MEEFFEKTLAPTVQTRLFDTPAPSGATDETNAQASNPVNDQDAVSCKCFFCGARVSRNDKSAYHEATSWVKGEGKKDSAVLRKYTGNVGCSDCINKIRNGMDAGQPELLETLEQDAKSDVVDGVGTGIDPSIAYALGKRDGRKGVPPVVPNDPAAAAQYNDGYQSGQAEQDEE